jgi:hypothetical protein
VIATRNFTISNLFTGRTAGRLNNLIRLTSIWLVAEEDPSLSSGITKYIVRDYKKIITIKREF